MLVVHQQNNQLAVAGVGPVMRTLASFVRQARDLQVERLHEVETRTCKLLGHPGLYDFTGLFESKERN